MEGRSGEDKTGEDRDLLLLIELGAQAADVFVKDLPERLFRDVKIVNRAVVLSEVDAVVRLRGSQEHLGAAMFRLMTEPLKAKERDVEQVPKRIQAFKMLPVDGPPSSKQNGSMRAFMEIELKPLGTLAATVVKRQKVGERLALDLSKQGRFGSAAVFETRNRLFVEVLADDFGPILYESVGISHEVSYTQTHLVVQTEEPTQGTYAKPYDPSFQKKEPWVFFLFEVGGQERHSPGIEEKMKEKIAQLNPSSGWAEIRPVFSRRDYIGWTHWTDEKNWMHSNPALVTLKIMDEWSTYKGSPAFFIVDPCDESPNDHESKQGAVEAVVLLELESEHTSATESMKAIASGLQGGSTGKLRFLGKTRGAPTLVALVTTESIDQLRGVVLNIMQKAAGVKYSETIITMESQPKPRRRGIWTPIRNGTKELRLTLFPPRIDWFPRQDAP